MECFACIVFLFFSFLFSIPYFLCFSFLSIFFSFSFFSSFPYPFLSSLTPLFFLLFFISFLPSFLPSLTPFFFLLFSLFPVHIFLSLSFIYTCPSNFLSSNWDKASTGHPIFIKLPTLWNSSFFSVHVTNLLSPYTITHILHTVITFCRDVLAIKMSSGIIRQLVNNMSYCATLSYTTTTTITTLVAMDSSRNEKLRVV